MSNEFYRIRRLPPYVFAEVNAMKAAARARGLGIAYFVTGVPDQAPRGPRTAFTAAETHAFRRTYALLPR